MPSENNPAAPVYLPASRYITFFALAVGGTAADLYSKWLVFKNLGMPGEFHPAAPSNSPMPAVWWLWDGVFGFQTSLNEGALFGMGQGQIPLFTTVSLIALVLIYFWLFWFRAAQSWLCTIVCAMFTAGILGNLYDRIGLPGLIWNYSNDLHQVGQPVYAVRDWILVMLGSQPWPNFNIADSLMVVGTAIMCFYVFFFTEESERKDEKTENNEESDNI